MRQALLFLILILFSCFSLFNELQAQNKKKKQSATQQNIDISKDYYSGKYQGKDGGRKLTKREGTFSGKITGPRQTLINSAQIELRQIGYGVYLEKGEPTYFHTYNDPRFWHILSNKDGSFFFNNLPVGRYEIYVEKVGYKPFSQVFKVSGHRNVHIKLDPENQSNNKEIYHLPEQEIVCHQYQHRFPQTENATSLNAFSMDGNPWQKKEMQLRNLPKQKLDIREDGRYFSQPLSTTYQFIDIEINSRAEIIKSGSPLSSKDVSTTPQINYISSQNSDDFGQFYMNAGLLNSYRVNLNLRNIKFPKSSESDFAINYQTSDGYINRSGQHTIDMKLQNRFQTNKHRVLSEISYKNNQQKSHWYGVPLDILEEDRQYNPLGQFANSDSTVTFYDDEKTKHNIANLWVNHNIFLTKGLGLESELDLKFHGQQMSQMIDTSTLSIKPYAPSAYIYEKYIATIHHYGSIGRFQSQLNYKRNQHNIFAEVIISRNDQWLNGKYHTEKVLDDSLFYDTKNVQQHLNLSGEYRVTLIDRLILASTFEYGLWQNKLEGIDPTGTKVDRNKINHITNTSFSAYYTASQFHSFSAMWSMNQTVPELSTLLWSEKISEDRSQNINFGYELSLRHFELKTNAYAMITRDELTSSGGRDQAGNTIYENVDRTQRMGIEMNGKYQHTGRWNVEGNISISQNKAKKYTMYYQDIDSKEISTIKFENTQLANAPNFQSNLLINYHILTGLRTTANLKYVGSSQLDHTDSELTKIDGYFTGNIFLVYSMPLKTSAQAPKKTKFGRTLNKGINSFKEVSFIARINNITFSEFQTSGWSSYYSEADTQKNIAAVYPQAKIYVDFGVFIKF